MTLLDRIVPSVQRAKTETGSHLLVSVALAQIILESDYGRSELAVKANNYGGHKYDPHLHTAWYSKLTKEWNGEKYITTEAKFAKYNDFDAFIRQHFNWFTSSDHRRKVYARLFKASTPQGQANALTGTYATDPKYAEKLMIIMRKYNLTQYDQEGDTVTLKMKQQFAPVRPNVNCFGYGNPKKYITIHQTGNPSNGANAQMHANLQSRVYGASWHWQVDDKEAIQSFPHEVKLWHSSDGNGPGNTQSIGIEGCINADGDYVKSVHNMAKFTAYIMQQENIPVENVRQHYDWDTRNRKNCPQQIRAGKAGITWAKFLDLVRQYSNGGSKYNPKGLATVTLNKYTSPNLPFDTLKVGDTVTIRKPHTFWYDPQTKQGIKPSKDFSGTTDKIKQVKDIDGISYSKRAYLLEKYNSWILEQDLVEARNSWVKVEDKPEVEVEDTHDHSREYTEVELKEGQFYLDGVLYEVSKVRK